MKLHPMWQDYPDLAKQLTTTLQLMEDVVKLKNKKVESAVLDMIHAGGKLLRPAYQCCLLNLVQNKMKRKPPL